jgi:hypothetical protein
MYLLYLDDAGSPGNVSEEYFVLGGICVYEAQADWFTREIDKLAAAFNPTSPEDVEFHASTIFSRREGPWKDFCHRGRAWRAQRRPADRPVELQHNAAVRMRHPQKVLSKPGSGGIGL